MFCSEQVMSSLVFPRFEIRIFTPVGGDKSYHTLFIIQSEDNAEILMKSTHPIGNMDTDEQIAYDIFWQKSLWWATKYNYMITNVRMHLPLSPI